MEKCSKKKIVYLFCLLEGWINHYHKAKKIRYVVLVDAICILILTVVLSLLTYLLARQFISNLFLQYSAFFFLYLFMLSIIVFQNLFDTDFNVITKVRLLVLSVISDAKIKKVIFSGLFYIISWIILVWFLSDSVDKYLNSKKIKIVSENTTLGFIILISFIIIFIVQVYGTNDIYIKCKRKLLLYGLSTIIASIITINSINSMYKNQIGVNILNFQFLVLVFSLIISIDGFVGNYTTLISEYNKKHKSIASCNNCEICKAKIITIETICSQITNYIKEILYGMKNVLNLFISYNIRRKITLIVSIPACIIFTLIFNDIFLFVLQRVEYIGGYIATYCTERILWVWILNFIKLTIYGLSNYAKVVLLLCIINSLKNVKNELIIILRKINIDFKMLREELKRIYIYNMIFLFLSIIPIAYNQIYEQSYNAVFLIIYSYLSVIIVYSVYKIIIKIKEKSYKIELNLKSLGKKLKIIFTKFYFYIFNTIILFQSILFQNQKLIYIMIYVMAIIISTSFILNVLFYIVEVGSNRIREYKTNNKNE